MSAYTDVLTQDGVGSTDWAGGHAPPGGQHTGTSTIVMASGASFIVACNRAEALRKLGPGQAPTTPYWIGFDVPNQALPIVLNGGNVVRVTALT